MRYRQVARVSQVRADPSPSIEWMSVNTMSSGAGQTDKMAWPMWQLSSRSITMNTAQWTQPEVLFGVCQHAGGWARLGWQMQADDELSPTCFDGLAW
jgi:hypothetical protein